MNRDLRATAPIYIRIESRSDGVVRLRIMPVGQHEVVVDMTPDEARALADGLRESAP